jgi:hypothetical protein
VGGICCNHDYFAKNAKLLPCFGEIPANFTVGAMLEMGDFFAPPIADDLYVICAVAKTPKYHRAVAGKPCGANRCQLDIAGLRLGTVQVQITGQGRSPWS